MIQKPKGANCHSSSLHLKARSRTRQADPEFSGATGPPRRAGCRCRRSGRAKPRRSGGRRGAAALKRLARKPSVTLAPTPIIAKSHHAGIGIRSSQAAAVASVELNTSFRPEATSAVTGVGDAGLRSRRGPKVGLELRPLARRSARARPDRRKVILDAQVEISFERAARIGGRARRASIRRADIPCRSRSPPPPRGPFAGHSG